VTTLQDITAYCNRLLAIDEVQDYCPNGLQVQGRSEVNRLVTGVTACAALIDYAIDAEADAVLVHHGYFWRGESQVLTGMKYQRIKRLLTHDIALLVYHLPLDVHPQLGNNAGLGRSLEALDITRHAADGVADLFWQGTLPVALSPADLGARIRAATGREALHVGPEDSSISQFGWCTGGAQRLIEQAADLSLDAFISGEISEQTTHIARERGISYFAAGHHATERFGVQALGEHLAARFDLSAEFVDIDNPA